MGIEIEPALWGCWTQVRKRARGLTQSKALWLAAAAIILRNWNEWTGETTSKQYRAAGNPFIPDSFSKFWLAPAVYQVLSAVLRVQRWISWFGRWKVYLTNSAKLGHGEVHTCPSNSWELLSIGYLSGKVHGGVFSLEFGSWKVMCFTKGFHLLPPPPESEL